MKSKQVEFMPPQGFTVPEGVSPGDSFDLVCSFKMKDSGMICMTELGDTKMPGYDDKQEERPSYGKYSEEMMAQGNNMPEGT